MVNYAKNFAGNLKYLRKKLGLSQKDIAAATGFSEKTVSKWECGASIPDINTLFAIARMLKTNINELFSDNENMYFLGIDGGGSKTELVLASADGSIKRSLKADCCNPIDIGIQNSKKILRDAIYEICSDISFSSIVAFAGIAGGTSADMKEKLADFFSEFQFRAFKNDSDNACIIEAGLGDRDGITLILGTGICAFSKLNGVFTRVAGWGYLIDSGGSAFNIGRDILNAYYCAIDGSGPATAITEEINALCPGGPQALIGRIYNDSKKTIASFAPVAFKLAAAGDRVAIDILKRNMSVAAHFIDTAAKLFKTEPIPVVLAGGLTEQPLLPQYLKDSLPNPSRYNIEILRCSPVLGAVSLARKLWQSSSTLH